ncbi:MAG: selenocysteine-specific translation elongation factor [Deltaproteobacteria bacterium]|nr:selenocysteine-specific translation elongation factor [Deltaproteobacteria bacterium]
MKRLVVAFAGHVDHGKTALVKALTGVDCDRLDEEKRRGITIESGYTSWKLPSGLTAGVVDVPGHEDFVKNMVAGVFGARIVILVVAADEGVMPQTREHLRICRLLGIEKIVAAVTKIDLVDPEELHLAGEDVREFLDETGYKGADVVPVSAVNGSGLDELAKAVSDVSKNLDPIDAYSTITRLYVDRSFNIRGFGTVVTGTLLSGRIEVNQGLEIFPSRTIARVRGIQVHGQNAESIEAGSRTALNLSGVTSDMVPRGSLVAAKGVLGITREVGVVLQVMDDRALPGGGKSVYTVHFGTGRINARITILGKTSNSRHLARLKLNAPVSVIFGEHFVIRGSRRSIKFGYTMGGGAVLHPRPPRLRNARLATLLARLCECSQEDALLAFADEQGKRCLTFPEARAMLGLNMDKVKAIASKLENENGLAIDLGGKIVTRKTLEALREDIKKIAIDWQERGKLSTTILAGKTGASKCMEALEFAVKEALGQGDIISVHGNIRPAGEHDNKTKDLEDKLAVIYASAGLAPPKYKELKTLIEADEKNLNLALFNLHEDGRLVRVKQDMSFSKQALDSIINEVREYLANQESITPSEFKNLAKITRKHAIPLLEYFDRIRITMRIGDKRVLRGKNK